MSDQKKRYGEYLLIAALLFFLFWKGVIPAWTKVHSDFSNYYVSARLITDHQSIDQLYNNEWFRQKAREYGTPEPGKFSPFPPISAWVMLPFSGMKILNAQRAFLFINIVFLGLGVYVLRKITNWSINYCILFFLVSGLGLINNFAFGQLYLIMTVGMLYSYWWMSIKREGLAGTTLAIFTSIKYFPIVLAGGYFIESVIFWKRVKNARLILSFAGILTLLFILQFLFFGKHLMGDFFHSSFLPHLDGELSDQGLYSFHFQSWDNLFRNLFIYHPEANPHPWINWPEGKTISKSVVLLIIVSSLIYLFQRYRQSDSDSRNIIYLAIPSLGAMVVLPASASYHFILLAFPLALLLSSTLLNKQTRILIISFYTFLGFIPYGLAFQLGHTYGILLAYPRLMLVSLIYVVTLFGLLRNLKA